MQKYSLLTKKRSSLCDFFGYDEKWDIICPILNKKRIRYKCKFYAALMILDHYSGNKTTPCFFFPSIFTTIG